MKIAELKLARQRLVDLSPEIAAHCQRVSQVAVDLARRHGADRERVAWAALIHDLARPMPPEELRTLAGVYSLPLDPVEQEMPLLLHGRVGAEILKRDFSVTDAPLLEAVAWHTTGRGGMDLLGKVLFLADKIEPHKLASHPPLKEVERLAQEDLDRAILEFYRWQVSRFLERNAFLHPALVEARNYLLKDLGEVSSFASGAP
ncbi:MAG: bis(5'-nucleosyl)-tetraphosphatase (symmetrical) YqeK [Chloroflexi bacterium]|nr:bis(5'-nucleosyl)-tetraphosphatase (symmetrical) YqeK [Chloroflexota bacterium]